VMFYMYILKSEKDSELYLGSTNDLRKRIYEHNSGKVQSTKPRRPFNLVYCEAYASEVDARVRESRLKKRGNARTLLIKRTRLSIDSI